MPIKLKMYSMISLIVAIGFAITVNSETFEVTTAKEFVNALELVSPGDTVLLSDTDFYGKFIANRSGTADQPITIQGSRSATVRGYSYAIWLTADYYVLKGFTVHQSLKGIVIEGANFNLLENIEVRDIKQEGIHFRYNSADNILRNSFIHSTGQGTDNDKGFGEGVYIGSAVSHWEDGPDKSDRNQVVNNQIGPNVTAEAIDIKEGSCCGSIKGNIFYGLQSGVNYADSWVDVKGQNYVIEDNIGYDALLDGYQLHSIADAGEGGCNNEIRNNQCNGIPDGGQCVNDASHCDNIIENNN